MSYLLRGEKGQNVNICFMNMYSGSCYLNFLNIRDN